MFWGLIMEPHKQYDQEIKTPFHLSMASLDMQVADDTPAQIMIKKDNVNYLLCTLKKNKVWQVPLDLNFEKGHKVTFLFNGTGRVHLTGYEIFDYSDIEESDSSEEEEEEEQVPNEKGKKRKAELLKGTKKEKLAKQEFVSEDDNQDENFQFSEDDSISDYLDETDDDNDDSYSEEEDKVKQEKPAKSRKYEKMEIENQQQQKKQKNKRDDKQNKINSETKQDQLSKKQKKKMEKEKNQDRKKILVGNVEVEELKIGDGPVATTNKLLTINYTGFIESSDKLIAARDGVKVRLFKGTMLKGMSIGIAGMRVGGRRLITIPPAMGYGAKGYPPVIPPNTTLVYRVELINVKD